MQKISILNKEYNYKIRYSKRVKYLKLQINELGIELILPVGVSIAEGERFMLRNRGWIEKNIGRYSIPPGEFFYLGQKIKIDQNFDVLIKHIKVETISQEVLRVTSAPGRHFSLKSVYDIWLKNQAKLIIPDRVKYLANKHNFRMGKVSLRNQKTRWGSCSQNGNLSFNFKLMMFDPAVIDYVIIHELCHLKEMNHSRKFWNEVEVIIPDYKELKNKLKKNIIK